LWVWKNSLAAQAAADFQRLSQSNAQTHAQTVALVIKEDNERLQKMAASLRTDERLQRMLSSFQAIEGPLQSLINLPKEDHERLQRIAASFRAMKESIQPLNAPPWFAALRDTLLPSPASILPTGLQGMWTANRAWIVRDILPTGLQRDAASFQMIDLRLQEEAFREQLQRSW